MAPWRSRLVPAVALVAAAWAAPGVEAQVDTGSPADTAWDSPRVLQLVERAREARRALPSDSSLRSYRADARGFVYFFLERPDAEERTLVKADQVALEVYWRAPDLTRQRIVGLRDAELLPTDIRYHLDHLTVVQDDFQDRIRLGDGDEVSDVLHPVAPGSERVYHFRLADSLTLVHSGNREVRVYEVQVRPRDVERSGFVGRVFLDRERGSIVRMRFTFTPASYVDPYLDYIRISLENSLWQGRYWLPYRQEAELRRELPALDFLAGSVIRGRFEVGPYVFNPDLPPGFFRVRGVTALPEARRRAFPFEDSLFSQLDEEGLRTPPSLVDIRDEAREMVGRQALSGLAALRLHLPSVSSAARYDRAGGTTLGAGTTLRSGATTTWRLHGEYALGAGRARLRVGVAPRGPEARGPEAEAWLHLLDDVGPVPGASGVLNSLSTLALNRDYTDPYRVSGGALHLPGPALEGPTPLRTRWSVGWERQRSARLVVDESDRPVRPIEEGDVLTLGATLAWAGGGEPTDGWGAELRPTLRSFQGRVLPGATFRGGWARTGGWRDADLEVDLRAGIVDTRAPPQLLFLLGGRETLLGHGYRRFAGDAFWLVRAVGSQTLVEPWISLRLLGAVGQAHTRRATLPEGWRDLDGDAGPRASLGAGLALFWDVLRVDVARGLDGGEWSVALSVTPRFRPWL